MLCVWGGGGGMEYASAWLVVFRCCSTAKEALNGPDSRWSAPSSPLCPSLTTNRQSLTLRDEAENCVSLETLGRSSCERLPRLNERLDGNQWVIISGGRVTALN